MHRFLHTLVTLKFAEETSCSFLALCLAVLLSLAGFHGRGRPVAQPSGMAPHSRQEVGKSENVVFLLAQAMPQYGSCALTFCFQ